MSDTASLSPQFFIDTLPARKILENAADFVALITPDGQILDINENGRMLMSIWDEIELADLTIVDLTAEAYQTLQQETALPTAIQEGSWQGEVVYQSRDGIEVPISQKIVGGFNLDEKTPLLIVFARDITERKWVETSLLESETRFRSSFENTTAGMALVSQEGRFLQTNTPLQDMLGYTDQEFIDRKSVV